MILPNSIQQPAAIIDSDWQDVSSHARPYLNAMYSLVNMSDRYAGDNAANIVCHFLGNARSRRGDTAQQVKDKLDGLFHEYSKTFSR